MAIIDSGETGDLRTRFHFTRGLRMELFYALQALTDDTDIHQDWRVAANRRLPAEFHQTFAALGNTPLIWPLLGDAPGAIDVSVTFDGLIDSLESLDLDTFRDGIMIGALHDADMVADVVEGRTDLATAIAGAPEHKRQAWYSLLGIYPYDEKAAVPVSLHRVLRDPGGFRADGIRCLRLFWEHVFCATWEQLKPSLLRSIEEKRRVFESSSVDEFLAQAIMRLEIDEDRQVLRALRGGCEISLHTLEAVHIMPSAFNARRMWTTYSTGGRDTAYVPYFDASIAVPPSETTGETAGEPATMATETQVLAASLEPALIFKALGDGTRYAMAQLIGRKPRTSADLARELGVTKATISHHLSLLREAGLVAETYEAGSIRLSLKTEVVEQLSSLATSAFAPAAEKSV